MPTPKGTNQDNHTQLIMDLIYFGHSVRSVGKNNKYALGEDKRMILKIRQDDEMNGTLFTITPQEFPKEDAENVFFSFLLKSGDYFVASAKSLEKWGFGPKGSMQIILKAENSKSGEFCVRQSRKEDWRRVASENWFQKAPFRGSSRNPSPVALALGMFIHSKERYQIRSLGEGIYERSSDDMPVAILPIEASPGAENNDNSPYWVHAEASELELARDRSANLLVVHGDDMLIEIGAESVEKWLRKGGWKGEPWSMGLLAGIGVSRVCQIFGSGSERKEHIIVLENWTPSYREANRLPT